MGKTHDVKCYELAEYFLDDGTRTPSPPEVSRLAQEIQDAIEDWFESRSIEVQNKIITMDTRRQAQHPNEG